MRLVTKAIEKRLPTRHRVAFPDPKIPLKLFDPCGSYTFYVWAKDDTALYGVETHTDDSSEPKITCCRLKVLTSYRCRFGLGIERDKYFGTKRLSDVLGAHVAATLIEHFTGAVSIYTTVQACTDGVLVDLRGTVMAGCHINVVSHTIWDKYHDPDLLKLRELVKAAEEGVKFNGSIISRTVNGEEFLIGPNDLDGYTLMFPDED